MFKYPVTDNAIRSAPHKRVEGILDDMGISYISEKPFRPYTVDIYLPEWHIALEIDGPMHSKALDRKRDEILLVDYALPILRLNARLWQQRGVIQGSVARFIEMHADTASERKAHAR